MIYADDYDKFTKDLEKKRKLKEKVRNLQKEDNLTVNDDKTKILKKLKHLKDSKGDPCRNTIKFD